ncbi:hypothetical protein TNCV_4465621 [Trichonephila clavipes]|nr:hypothetical protein TNCV_4465621 [Trichonephila clavipes]
MTTTTGEKTFQASDKSSNGRVQHVRMYGGYFLRIASFSSDRLDGPNRYTHEISNIPTTRSLLVLNLRPRRPWVLEAPANDSVFPNICIRNALTGLAV